LQENRDPTRLLPSGRSLAEAEELLRARRSDLDAGVIAFVSASRASHRRGLWLRYGFATALLLLVGMGTALLYSRLDALLALEQRQASAARTDIEGTMVAYASSPGQAVLDGEGEHGLYTGHLLEQLAKPQLSVIEAVLATHDAVLLATRDDRSFAQTPQLATSLNGDIFLHSPPPDRITKVFVVGVGAYQHLNPLKNPVSDATGVAGLLQQLGYQVDLCLNPDGEELRAAAETFLQASSRGPEQVRRQTGESASSGPRWRIGTAGWGLRRPAALFLRKERGGDGTSLPDVSPPPDTAQPPAVPDSPRDEGEHASCSNLSFPGTTIPDSHAKPFINSQANQQAHLAIAYFAGIGVEIEGRSLFAPADAAGEATPDLIDSFFDVSAFLQGLERSVSARIAILDFPRHDPFSVPR
jgi:hypothetical protein